MGMSHDQCRCSKCLARNLNGIMQKAWEIKAEGMGDKRGIGQARKEGAPHMLGYIKAFIRFPISAAATLGCAILLVLVSIPAVFCWAFDKPDAWVGHTDTIEFLKKIWRVK